MTISFPVAQFEDEFPVVPQPDLGQYSSQTSIYLDLSLYVINNYEEIEDINEGLNALEDDRIASDLIWYDFENFNHESEDEDNFPPAGNFNFGNTESDTESDEEDESLSYGIPNLDNFETASDTTDEDELPVLGTLDYNPFDLDNFDSASDSDEGRVPVKVEFIINPETIPVNVNDRHYVDYFPPSYYDTDHWLDHDYE